VTTISAFLDRIDSQYANKLAFISGDRTLTFTAFRQRVAHVAGGLAALGIGAGDRVVVWLPNVPAWLEVACACAQLGAIAIACNTRFRNTEVGDILERSRARVLVFWPEFKKILFVDILGEVPAAQLANLETLVRYEDGDWPGSPESASAGPVGPRVAGPLAGRREVTYRSLLDAAPAAATPAGGGAAEPDGRSGFLCFLTSGTTSRPKFALHSQGGIVQHSYDMARALGYGEPDVRVLTMNPLCGVLGFNQALAALAAGVPQVLPAFFDAADVVETIPRERITHALGIDEAFHRVFDRADGARPFQTLRVIGGGSYNGDYEAFVRRAEALGVTAIGIYGMSEIGAVFSCQRADAPSAKRATAGGYPISPHARVRTRDPQSGELLSADETGELEFTGPSQMLGYLDDPAATSRAVTSDGYVRSGDIGRAHADGSFSFVSRTGDALRLSGFLVSPQEIAGVLEGHPSVERCQVVGCAVAEVVRAVAFVIPREPGAIDEDALIAWCKARLAPFKAPVRVLSLDAFPVSTGPNGEKVQHAKLREIAASMVG
jgi:fatty-acyl-CoA synthase